MTNSESCTVRLSIELPLDPSAAFDSLVDELETALSAVGLSLEVGQDGSVMEGDVQAGKIVAWVPGERILLEWRAASWQVDDVSQIELLVEPVSTGTRITLEHRDWGRLIGTDAEPAGWFVSAVIAPYLRRVAPEGFGDWITERGARRPSGAQSRAVYADPLYHYPGFSVILEELELRPEDRLIEIGCGGGAMLKQALESGCTAAGVDHSRDMVRTARQLNTKAIEAGRLEIHQADGGHLPFSDEAFTCAAMTGVLGFLRDPVAVLKEIRRVLKSRGRVVVAGSDPELRGTPGAPEPFASRLRFYDDDALLQLAHDAGFQDARVVRRGLSEYARKVGVPEEHLPLFALEARFLLAQEGERPV